MFGTLSRTPPYWPKSPPTAAEAAFSNAMIGYWSQFARTGAPQAAGEPDWPAFGPRGLFLAFQDAPRVGADLMPAMYAFNEEVVCRRRASGDQAWNWNVGLYSPPLPPKAAGC